MPESENSNASEKHTETTSSIEAPEATSVGENVWRDIDRSSYTTSGRHREGSPFAVDPEPLLSNNEADQEPMTAEAFYDIGPMRYMALGAVLAASIVILFAAASAYWFPGGGVLVAGLGCVLAIFGLFSPRPRTAGGLLIVHLGIFVTAFARMI